MNSYPENIKFKYSWRKYQQKVLDDLQEHLTDKHLHVIAPPGSGKTVLGLEVAIRINQPTLILAPTIAIRNQWIQRFCELFLQTNTTPDWISRDIRQPKFMTVVTYQGLHAACNNLTISEEENEEEETKEDVKTKSDNQNFDTIVKGLKKEKIQTIVVDEAHHLKNEWWQTLTKIKEKLDPIVVGLTATPPYDVSAVEWQRYTELNGAVDSEISVPELVIEGDLCPHQDYVFFTLPSEKEQRHILDFRQGIERLFREIKEDKTLLQAIENHPILINPLEQLDWIYTNLAYYSASLIFLNANGVKISEKHLDVIGDKEVEIPVFDFAWMETLLDFYLYKDKEYFKAYEAHQEELINRLRRYGAIEKKQINFHHNNQITSSLSSSISKLNGIKRIVDFEYGQLGQNLRLVVLADYIRKEFLSQENENNIELNKIGVIPIFEILRRDFRQNKKIAVLTGSIVIIPAAAYPALEAKLAQYENLKIASSPLPYDNRYLLLQTTEQLKHHIVHLITQIFQEGEIEVLVGTKSLLGEGWDAPAINALILASFVGSFVLSNQMRGRAIRTQQGNAQKTGNIWHLVCVDSTEKNGGDDLDLLKRRFKSFVGISVKEEAGIENGIGRLDLPENIFEKEIIETKNAATFALAADRNSLRQRWDLALKTGVNLVEEIKIPFPEKTSYVKTKKLYFQKTIGYSLATLSAGLVGFGGEGLFYLGRHFRNIKTVHDLYFYLGLVGVAGIAMFGRSTYKNLRLYLKYRDISKDIHKIGEALLRTLNYAKVLHSNISTLKIETATDSFGAVYCHLEGGTAYDKSLFTNTLQEIIAPIDNPRYVLVRKNRFMLFGKQKDYHSVPELIGRNKDLAEFFKAEWEKWVGNCDLIFTRNLDGRKLLLKFRVKSLAAQFEDKTELLNKWR